MDAVIKFLASLEVPIYLILGIVAIIYLRRFSLALDERRSAVFGLEREAAQRRVTGAVTILILVGLLTVGEFSIATFLAPELEHAAQYATPTATPMPVTETPGPVSTDATPTNTAYPQARITDVPSNCEAGVLEISSPEHGSEVSGVVEILGSVNTPNFGSYKYEYAAWDHKSWQTIAAGGEVRIEQNLGNWYTSALVPGDYLLRLVALDNDGNETGACVVALRVVAGE
jgi:hypothetical protein